MKKSSVDHVGVFVSDLRRSRAFCERWLGLRFLEQDEDDFAKIATLRAGDQEVHLFQPKRRARPGFDHVSLRVTRARFEAVQRGLKRRGIRFSGPHAYKRTRFIKFRDPDGLTWELLTT